MKKILLIIAIALGSLNLYPQTNLDWAVDFKTVDIHGDSIHLFDILDKGQYVLLDFFFYQCYSCSLTINNVKQAYEDMGCNSHDIFFIEISDRDSDELCQQWCDNFGIEYPTISGEKGGDSITSIYGINSWPTLVVIDPNRYIVYNQIYPIPYPESITFPLTQAGLEMHDCPFVLQPPKDLAIETHYPVDSNINILLSWTPPEGIDNPRFNVYKDEILIASEITESSFQDILLYDSIKSTNLNYEYCVTTVTDSTESEDATCESVNIDLCQPAYNLLCPINNKSGYVLLAWNFKDFFNLAKELKVIRDNDTIATLPIEQDSTYLYEDKDPSLIAGETYIYKIASIYDDCIAETEDTEIVALLSVEDNMNDFNLFPNPATNTIYVKGTDIQKVEIINLSGKIIETINIDNKNIKLDTSKYPKGTYIFRILFKDNSYINEKVIIR